MRHTFSLAIVAFALYGGAATAQPHAFGGGARYAGDCMAYSQLAKAESQGPCSIDVGPPRVNGVQLLVRFDGRSFRVDAYKSGLCAINGTPCRLSDVDGGRRMRAEVSPDEGIEFPTPD